VSTENFDVEPLSEARDRSRFSCGNEALDRYFREQAGQDVRRRLTRVFVLVDSARETVAGFYTLSSCHIEPEGLPSDLAKRLPRRPLPATLIGRLAVALEYQGRGLGKVLLADALLRAAQASRMVGAMSVIVDAKDEQARAFYEHHGLRRFTTDPFRLFLQMSDAVRWREES
jgi:GNAT superfamily N-acetyltransferase